MIKNFDEAVKNIDYCRIMDKVCSRYNKYIERDDLLSIRLDTLWKCLDKYDPSRKTKFTTYLYQQLNFAIKNFLKKRKREFTNIPFETYREGSENINLVLADFPEEYATLLKQKYIFNMTMQEIGESNGYSRETARRKINRAKQYLKDEDRSTV